MELLSDERWPILELLSLFDLLSRELGYPSLDKDFGGWVDVVKDDFGGWVDVADDDFRGWVDVFDDAFKGWLDEVEDDFGDESLESVDFTRYLFPYGNVFIFPVLSDLGSEILSLEASKNKDVYIQTMITLKRW